MIASRLSIPDVVLLRPKKIGDARGYFVETFNAKRFREHVGAHEFVQDNEAMSAATGTVRGLHFQRNPCAQGKLVRAVKGGIFDVAVDIRQGSPTYGRHVAVHLTPENGDQLWVPPGFAHGYCTTEADSVIAYKVTNFYSAADDAGLAWDDPALDIPWPVAPGEATLSDKDRRQPRLAELPALFTYEPSAGARS